MAEMVINLCVECSSIPMIDSLIHYCDKGTGPRGVGNCPAGPVLAGPLFIKVKTKFHFVSNKQKR